MNLILDYKKTVGGIPLFWENNDSRRNDTMLNSEHNSTTVDIEKG